MKLTQIFFIIASLRHQYMTDPDRFMYLGKKFCKFQNIVVLLSCQDLMSLRIDFFDIQEQKICHFHQLAEFPEKRFLSGKWLSGGIDHRMHPLRLCFLKELQHKIQLQQWFSTAYGDSSFSSPVPSIPQGFLKKFFRSVPGSLSLFPCIGIMAELTPHVTALHKDYITDSRSVH